MTKAERREKAEQLFQAITERFEITITPAKATDRHLAELIKNKGNPSKEDVKAITKIVSRKIFDGFVSQVHAMWTDAFLRTAELSHLAAALTELGLEGSDKR
jgi:ribosomal protein L18